MNFTTYSKKIREVKNELEINRKNCIEYEIKISKLYSLLKFVHGAWKLLSQAVENGENEFTMVVNTNYNELNIQSLVNELRDFSFDVEYTTPNEDGMAYGEKVLGKDRTGIYVLKFNIKEEKEESKSWADLCCEDELK